MKKSIILMLFVFITSLCLGFTVNGQENYDYSKILNGDLSDFVGTWKTAEGSTFFLCSDGITMRDGMLEGEKADYFCKNEDGTYSWSVLDWISDEWGYGGGFAIILYPVGVDVIVYGRVVDTDTSRVRLFAGQDYAPIEEMSGSIYYLQPLFSDVPENHWAFEYIKAFADIGILAGYEDGTFKPDAPVTRAEWAKMLVSTFGLPIDEYWRMSLDLQSCDVLVSDWYAPYIYTAEPYFNAEHINTGDQPIVNYKPLEGATREDITVSVVKILEAAGYSISDDSTLPFHDVNTISTNWKRYIAFAVNNGIISGFEDNTFRGKDTLTRAEAATILYKTMLFAAYN